uniref:Protein E6 n=1 Tax=Human papillomavirus TaxID=10566 RepID=A0A385PLE3_9PAPI|nr:MAG: E6 protein [Human papillomavirus]
MAEELFPTRLDEYCRYFDISFFVLRLRCIFCNSFLDPQDLARFYMKQLNLIWKNKVAFGCCTLCLNLSAIYEKTKFFQCTVNSVNIEHLARKSLKDIPVRCLFCLKLLDLAEKFDIKVREDLYCLVRGHWRGVCRECKKKE